MKALGLKFQDLFWILNFRQFSHVLEHFEHRPDPDFRKKWKIPDLVNFWALIQVAELIFWWKLFPNFFPCSEYFKNYRGIFYTISRSKVTSSNVKSILRFFRILAQTLYKSLTNLYRILPKIRKIWKSRGKSGFLGNFNPM